MIKICSKCKQEKDIINFHKDKTRPDRLSCYCKNCIKEYQKVYRNINIDNIKRSRRKSYLKNKQQTRNTQRIYESNKYKNNTIFRLKNLLRSRVRNIIKNKQKSGSAVYDLGCTIDFLEQYLESKFQPGMTWDNYGRNGWHIDHIIPLSSFDLTDREQFLKACHYTNLQPLWAEDNLKKSDKILDNPIK